MKLLRELHQYLLKNSGTNNYHYYGDLIFNAIIAIFLIREVLK